MIFVHSRYRIPYLLLALSKFKIVTKLGFGESHIKPQGSRVAEVIAGYSPVIRKETYLPFSG